MKSKINSSLKGNNLGKVFGMKISHKNKETKEQNNKMSQKRMKIKKKINNNEVTKEKQIESVHNVNSVSKKPLKANQPKDLSDLKDKKHLKKKLKKLQWKQKQQEMKLKRKETGKQQGKDGSVKVMQEVPKHAKEASSNWKKFQEVCICYLSIFFPLCANIRLILIHCHKQTRKAL